MQISSYPYPAAYVCLTELCGFRLFFLQYIWLYDFYILYSCSLVSICFITCYNFPICIAFLTHLGLGYYTKFSMTSGAQQALRRTMEIYSNSTRFALACNTSSKIIEPIQSRCALVRFSRLTDQEILGRLMIVVQAEKVNICIV